ncbi:DNA-binding SARP family transcriptional activator [Blastococcus colisei]|uniref:DNA-binding SARP family transcriptional activator n=1 Tax=Blastococcus colisei TaxID=1564162 RepID=A0A543PBP9_9ACTN|nr:BTAD domain-containing putative transcriptional regulator [Blastococcus colisei]TQN41474.1 DNA-binding SARP family transcriptional activator [Blastococcus colisei]
MRVAVLGPLEVRTDSSAPVHVPGAKERLLLAVLVAGAPGIVSTDSLAEALWDGDPPVSARKSLQAHVVRLRSALEPDRPTGSPGRFVVRRGPGYALTLDRDSVDALRITDLAGRGSARLAAGELEEAERELRAAVALWRGEPYADWPDAGFASAERRRLAEVRASAIAGLLEAQLQLGRHAEVLPELERLVTQEPLREGWWRLLMLALYRAGRQADALAAGRRVRALLADELGAEPGPALRAVERAVLTHDPSLVAPRPPTRPVDAVQFPGSCPYKGLAAYQVDDAPLFHGRRRLVESLVTRLVDAPLLVVSGPSGAGKSSVVRAGLVPALVGGALPASRTWRPVIVPPGRAPVDVLAQLAGDPPPADPVLLVCDQFEELWAPGIDPAERRAFLDAVLGLLADRVVVRCVVVVRGDHVGRLAEHPAFTDHLGAAFALVPPLTEPELREIVREPASAVGLRVDPELVDTVVTDVLGQAGALPLLSTALVGTWERRRGDVLTLAGYLEAGGVSGALMRSAESAYAALDETEQDVARRILVRLADTDDGGALVRRPVPLAELDLSGARREVVETFVERRLLAVDGSRLEVAHEALLTEWPRLGRWLEDDAAGRVVRRHLAPAAREWEAAGRPEDELYRGARLTAALDWATTAGDELTPVERDFLDASRAHAERDLVAARQRAEREARGRRRTRRLAAGLAAALVVALVAGALTLRAQREATRASLVADANRLAALSTTVGSLDVSLLLAAQAVRLADTSETEDGLLTALVTHRRAERVAPFVGQAGGALLADDGGTLFIGAGAQVAAWRLGPTSLPEPLVEVGSRWRVWRASDASPTEGLLVAAGWGENDDPWVRSLTAEGTERLLLADTEVGGLPIALSFTADGRAVRLLLAHPDDAGVRWTMSVLDPVTGSHRKTGVGGMSPAAVGDLLAHVSDAGGSAVLWDFPGAGPATLVRLDDGSQVTLQVPQRTVGTVAFHALESGAAQAWADGVLTLYDAGGRAVQELDVGAAVVRDVAVAADGSWAVTVGGSDTVQLWAIDPTSGRWSSRGSLTGHDADVLQAEVDPAGERLLTVSLDDTVIAWDMTADAGFGESHPGVPDRWISNRPQHVEPTGMVVAPTRSGSSLPAPIDRGPDSLGVAATFLDPGTGSVVEQVEVGDTLVGARFGSSVSVSPDGALVAVTSGFATTVLDTGTAEVVERIVLPPTGEVFEGEPLPAQVVWCTGWTPDGSRLLLCAEGELASGTGGQLVVVDTATWEVTGQVDIGGAAQVIETSPDDRHMAVAMSNSSALRVLDADTLETQETIEIENEDLQFDLSFSPDGRYLATGGDNGLLHLYDTRTWQRVWSPIPTNHGMVVQVEWRPDSRTVVTSGEEGTVTLVDVERGLARSVPLPGSDEPGQGRAYLAMTRDDEIVVLASQHAGRRYPMEPSVWLADACAVVGRDLTSEEWSRYLPGRERAPTCTDLD